MVFPIVVPTGSLRKPWYKLTVGVLSPIRTKKKQKMNQKLLRQIATLSDVTSKEF